ncbi:efflux transporter outer membrane subunit [Marinimicrobium agarilyticum]|uniref:efflux transporter outer membrane subunit n=1 Tax=Marinimicrobium agarilyticum TaxID=306546 RepID=UPI00041F4772|nr:efflux transporter outer membrane subunit [Marinimicrobium agarilyticum]
MKSPRMVSAGMFNRCALGMLLLAAGCARVEPIDRPELDSALTWNSVVADEPHSMDVDKWWQRFESPELNGLLTLALAQSPDLEEAEQRLRQAQWQLRSAGATVFPSLTLGASTRSGRSENENGNWQESESTSANVGLSYELDLWGRVAAERTAARASFAASEFDYRAARLSLTGAVANAWFEYQALLARVEIARENIALSEEVMRVVNVRYQNGAASAADVARQRTSLLSQKAQLPPLQFQAEQTRRAVAVLLGEWPQRLSLSETAFQAIAIPELAPGTPAQALYQRPDIGAAEARLQAADANVAAARRAFLPEFSLSAGISLATDGLFSLSNAEEGRNVALSLSQLLFDGGRTRAQTNVTEARRLELLAQYRQTLLTALQETDDALGQVALQRQQAVSDRAILEQAERTLRLTEVRYREGSDDLLTLIDAQRSLFQARDQLIQRRLNRLSAAVTLYQSIGG